MKKLVAILLEIGDASSKAFKWTWQGSPVDLSTRMKEDGITATAIAQSDTSGIKYVISIEYYMVPGGFRGDIAFSVSGKNSGEFEQETGANEVYRVLATVMDVIEDSFLANIDYISSYTFSGMWKQSDWNNRGLPQKKSQRNELYMRYIENYPIVKKYFYVKESKNTRVTLERKGVLPLFRR